MNEDTFLYHRIAEAVRRQILQGEIKPGDQLPPIREMTLRWGCTIGTVQRAYQELARQGLVTGRAGRGTRVDANLRTRDEAPLRRAALVHRAEAFLLEVLTAGYEPVDVEDAVRQALDHWRTVTRPSAAPNGQSLNFCGSHDLVLTWLASHFDEIAPGYTLPLSFTGSLGGLIALAENKAHLAGCHLWDDETDTYNLPFVHRLLPGRRVAVITLAHRRIGLIVRPDNPLKLYTLPDLARPGVRFVNRQPGSGTRVWLDAQLHRIGIDPATILGYDRELMTHSEVARFIAEGQADVGLGLEAAAQTYGLDFVLLTRERYDLVIPATHMDLPPAKALREWLLQPQARQIIQNMAGYEAADTGKITWLE